MINSLKFASLSPLLDSCWERKTGEERGGERRARRKERYPINGSLHCCLSIVGLPAKQLASNLQCVCMYVCMCVVGLCDLAGVGC